MAVADVAAAASAVAAAHRAAAAAALTQPLSPAIQGPPLRVGIAELERQAEERALKSLASVDEGQRALKLPIVKAGILKQLLAQAGSGSSAIASPAPLASGSLATTPSARSSVTFAEQFVGDDSEVERPAGLNRQPTELPPPQNGVEFCGDDPWFADQQIRLALRDAVEVAHSQLKILVGDPGAEIARICPLDGRVLGAGATLRLGGSHLGGYGEPDIAYSYRQLSRALHPDKNSDNPNAAAAFKRLGDAREELTRGLEELRAAAQKLSFWLRGRIPRQELARPHEALFAETSRLLMAVISLNTEGEVSPAAARQAMAFLQDERGSWARPHNPSHSVGDVLQAWFDDGADLLATCGSPSIRSAYDCAPKRYRAHFVCLLARLAYIESRRQGGCVRQRWQNVWNLFPEIDLWQTLRQILHRKCLVHGRSRREHDKKEEEGDSNRRKRSKVEDLDYSQWAKRWRKMIRAVLPGAGSAAAQWSDPELGKLCAALWRDFVDPLAKESDDSGGDQLAVARRALGLFRTESRGAADVAKQQGAAPAEWAYVPAADLLLVVGEGLVGITLEGVFTNVVRGTPTRLPFATAVFQTMLPG